MNKETGATIISNPDPLELINLLEANYKQNILPRHLKFLEGHDPDGELEGKHIKG